jgi:hypothetical protein
MAFLATTNFGGWKSSRLPVNQTCGTRQWENSFSAGELFSGQGALPLSLTHVPRPRSLQLAVLAHWRPCHASR